MKKFFDFYEPLERRYLFNSFLIVVAVVEVLIFVFTLIWQIDEGVLGGPVKVVPFPWMEYFLVAFAAPIALLLIFGLTIRGFEAFSPDLQTGTVEGEPASSAGRKSRRAFYWGAGGILVCLALWGWGRELLVAATSLFKALGLAGTYVMAGLLGAVCLYLTVRLYLTYRLQKRALELRYLQYLTERHGLVLPEEAGVPAPPPTLEGEAATPEMLLLEDKATPSKNSSSSQ